MLTIEHHSPLEWLCTGTDMFAAMLRDIEAATFSVSLETYIFAASPLGERFRDALIRARGRGVAVRVLVDAVGSMGLPGGFWGPLREAGGEVRQFNPIALKRFWFRDHRKLLVCDRRIAFAGGFNIAPEYEGDGIRAGWRDLGIRITGPLAAELEASFDDMFARADIRQKRFLRLDRFETKPVAVGDLPAQLLLSAPCWGRNPIQRALLADLAQARDVRIMAAYFLPSLRLRRDLIRVAPRGGRVQLILAGKSDVMVSQLAAQSLYRRLLKGGVEIQEYQPQVLHAKLIVVDDIVYVGSSNLDQRSLRINYEMMIRLADRAVAEQARDLFAVTLPHCRRIESAEWRRSRSFWQRLKRRAAYFLLVRVDPYIARWQWRAVPD
jgi:cardiolipin synthase A/B